MNTETQLDQIIKFEQGELDFDETIELFQSLVDSKIVNQLQGYYGRTAKHLIENGYIKNGK
jgi:hypothetical protein